MPDLGLEIGRPLRNLARSSGIRYIDFATQSILLPASA
jgi:hypothetical protein